MKTSKWIYYVIAGLLALVYYISEATEILFRGGSGLLFLSMLIILPLGFWVIWNINPDKPSD